jgi:hypothetical protein
MSDIKEKNDSKAENSTEPVIPGDGGRNMSDIPDDTPEKQDVKQTESLKPLSAGGREAMQSDITAYQRDLEKYIEELNKHKTRMQEIGNQQAVTETDDEIQKINQILYENVQKKHGIEPGQGKDTAE